MKVFSGAVLAIFFAGTAFANEGHFAQKHPRRAQLNHREQHQMREINKEVKEGKISGDEAQKLRGEVRDVHQEQAKEVRQNGGYLTKGEQKELNQELSKTRQDIQSAKQH